MCVNGSILLAQFVAACTVVGVFTIHHFRQETIRDAVKDCFCSMLHQWVIRPLFVSARLAQLLTTNLNVFEKFEIKTNVCFLLGDSP